MSLISTPIRRRVLLLALLAIGVVAVALASDKGRAAKSVVAETVAEVSAGVDRKAASDAADPGTATGGGARDAEQPSWVDSGEGARTAERSAGGDTAAGRGRPNVVFILSDDQPASTFSAKKMPRTRKALGRAGMTFTDSIAAPPLCCPYRASFLGGQYAHNTGVDKNRPGYGDLSDPNLVLPVFLRNAGYRTAFLGKFLNGSTAELGSSPAPGWDHWFAMNGRPRYQGAEFSVNGNLRTFGPRSHTSQVLTREARRFIERESRTRAPFFLWLAHFAPHPARDKIGPCRGPRTAKPRAGDYRFAKQFGFPRNGNFNRGDRGGKPGWVADNKPLSRKERQSERRKWRCMLAASQQVDRSVAQVVRQLRRSGELGNTWVVFGSDNGFHFGEHRIRGKRGSYEEMLRVPLVIRPPAEPRFKGQRGKRNGALVSQVDLAATIADVAGAETCVGARCRVFDGHSLVPLLRGGSPSWSKPGSRAVPIRLRGCTTMALRTSKLSYIETRDSGSNRCGSKPSFRELYELGPDRGQVRNLVPDRRVRNLARRMATLQQCAGVPERASLLQPGRPPCE